jgi:hypothetical protein
MMMRKIFSRSIMDTQDACFFWAARWLAVLSMQNEIRISLFICPFSGSASPADALLQIGGYSSAW